MFTAAEQARMLDIATDAIDMALRTGRARSRSSAAASRSAIS